MIEIREFLSLKKLPLDLKVINEWQHAVDPEFIEYILAHDAELDYQHLRSAMRLLQNVNRDDVRQFFSRYVNHTEIGYRTLARGSLKEHLARGWIRQLPEW